VDGIPLAFITIWRAFLVYFFLKNILHQDLILRFLNDYDIQLIQFTILYQYLCLNVRTADLLRACFICKSIWNIANVGGLNRNINHYKPICLNRKKNKYKNNIGIRCPHVGTYDELTLRWASFNVKYFAVRSTVSYKSVFVVNRIIEISRRTDDVAHWSNFRRLEIRKCFVVTTTVSVERFAWSKRDFDVV